MALELAPSPDLSPEMQAYFDKCREKIGFVPNVLLAYAHDSAKLEAFAALYNDLMLAPSGLSKLEREMIAVAVSSVNRCYYCLTANGAAVRSLSGDPVLGEMMAMNYRAADLSPRHRAMLDFAVALTEAPWTIEEEDARPCAMPASPSATCGTSPRWRASSTCRTAWPRPSTCARTRSYHGEARGLPIGRGLTGHPVAALSAMALPDA